MFKERIVPLLLTPKLFRPRARRSNTVLVMTPFTGFCWAIGMLMWYTMALSLTLMWDMLVLTYGSIIVAVVALINKMESRHGGHAAH